MIPTRSFPAIAEAFSRYNSDLIFQLGGLFGAYAEVARIEEEELRAAAFVEALEDYEF